MKNDTKFEAEASENKGLGDSSVCDRLRYTHALNWCYTEFDCQQRPMKGNKQQSVNMSVPPN